MEPTNKFARGYLVLGLALAGAIMIAPAPGRSESRGSAQAFTVLSPSVQEAIANGSDVAGFEITAADGPSSPLPNATIELTSGSRPQDSTIGLPAVTDAAGMASFFLASTLESDGALTTYTFTVTPDVGGGLPFDVTADVTWRAGSANVNNSSVMADPMTIEASSGASAATVTVTVRDANNNTPSNVFVHLISDRGSAVDTLSNPAITDENGQAAQSFSSESKGSAVLTATVNGPAITQTIPVMVDNADADLTTTSVVVFDSQVSADGVSPAIAEVVVNDVFGNPVDGANVDITAGLRPEDVATGVPAMTDAAGSVPFSLTSTRESDGSPVSYTIGVIPGAGDGTPFSSSIDITWGAGQTDLDNSTVSADPTEIDTAPGSQSIVSVTVLDVNNNTVPGVFVRLISDRGSRVDSVSAPVITAEDGRADLIISSSTPGLLNLTATANGRAIGQTVDLIVNVLFTSGFEDP